MINPFQYLKKINTRIAKTSFVFVLVLIGIYFWINGKAHFSNWDQSYGQMISVYLLMVVVFLIWSGHKTRKEINRPIHESLGVFVGFFISTYFLLSIITYFSGTDIIPIDASLFWPMIILQVCVIATPEELMFRGVLLEKFGILISSVLFAIWHSFAYGLIYYSPETINQYSFISLFIAFTMGLIFAMVTKKWGIGGAIAIHASYNLFVSGVFVTFGML